MAEFAFDMDGVIATPPPTTNTAAPPHTNRPSPWESAPRRGQPVLYTARGSQTGIDWQSLTRQQLDGWGVRYHEVRFGKPAADYYIDDRMMSFASLRSWMSSCSQNPSREGL